MFTSVSYAQTGNSDKNLELGTRFLPSKLVENQDGMIQVYAKQGNNIVPEKVIELTVTSLDSSILRVVNVQESNAGFVSDVTVKSLKPGSTKIFLAAPGFAPIEVPVTVHGNKLNQEQLLVKATPDMFSSNGPFRGVISVELADEDGYPIVATEDVPISLGVSNSILDIFQRNIVIKEGEYFAGTQFTVGESGRTTIFASGENLEGKSNEITIDEEENDQTISLFVFPKEINILTQSSSKGHIVALLHDREKSSGSGSSSNDCDFEAGDSSNNDDSCKVALAKNDITVTYKVTPSDLTTSNISNGADIGEDFGTFTIKKGTYWGHTTFDVLAGPGFEGTYDITISSGDPIALDKAEIEAVLEDTNNDGSSKNQHGTKFVKFDTLPIFATGNKELIGVVHLEDKEGYPILAEEYLEIKIDSSDDDFVSIDPVSIARELGSALVFGNVGHVIPKDDEDLELNAAVEIDGDDPQLVETLMFGPDEESLELKAEPLVSKVLSNTEFPIVAYFEDKNGVTKFPANSELFVSPSDIFESESKMVSQGTDLVMIDSSAIGRGSDDLQLTFDEYETKVTIDSLYMKPATIFIDNSEILFPGTNDVFSIQLLNEQQMPVFATEDIDIKLVVKDESLLQVPESITIQKGNYFTLFDAAPKKSGITEISALAEGLPFGTSTVEIKDLTPALEMVIPEIVEEGESFVAELLVTQDELPLSEINVKWIIEGGATQLADKKTSQIGIAKASIIATSNSKVDIKAEVSGSFYDTATINKIVRVNATASEFVAFAEDGQPEEFSKFEIAGIDPVIIIVPAAIGIIGYMLKRQGVFGVRKEPIQTPQINE